jgi:uncharacterized protein
MALDAVRARGRPRPGRFVLPAALLCLVVVAPAILFLRTSAGRELVLGSRIGWITKVQGGRPDALARLFREDLTGHLQRAGIDTSLIRVESTRTETGALESRWEVPLPEGFGVSRGNAVVTRRVERFRGRIVDGVEEESNRVRLVASIGPRYGVEVLLMGKEAPKEGARIAILVDRFGFRNMQETQALLEFGRGLTVAILPHTTGARDLADQCRARGLEVVLNLPMEGLDYPRVDPGPGAILVDMSPGDITKRVAKAHEQIGGARGVHTYMGGLAVEDKDVMRAILQEVADRRGYFVESTSSTFSVVRETAAQVGAASIRLRDTIDGPQASVARVKENLEDVAVRARQHGVAVGLVHPYPATVQALKELLPVWRHQGIDLVPLSEIVTVPHD